MSIHVFFPRFIDISCWQLLMSGHWRVSERNEKFFCFIWFDWKELVPELFTTIDNFWKYFNKLGSYVFLFHRQISWNLIFNQSSQRRERNYRSIKQLISRKALIWYFDFYLGTPWGRDVYLRKKSRFSSWCFSVM